MKKIVIATVACFAIASVAGCSGMGKGKGKGKAPVAPAPMVQEEVFVTKG